MSRSRNLGVRLTPEQENTLKEAAAKKGLSLSAYIRWAALERADAEEFMERVRRQHSDPVEFDDINDYEVSS